MLQGKIVDNHLPIFPVTHLSLHYFGMSLKFLGFLPEPVVNPYGLIPSVDLVCRPPVHCSVEIAIPVGFFTRFATRKPTIISRHDVKTTIRTESAGMREAANVGNF